MVAKEDKDGQIALLREALEKIQDEIQSVSEWNFYDSSRKIEKIAQTALFDTTF